MIVVILIILGLCLGSFVNAFVWRFAKQHELAEQQGIKGKLKKLKQKVKPGLTAEQLSISKGRSMCTHCHHPLAAKDLVPVVSYVGLLGKCRYCGKPIEDNPLAELLTPALFVASYLFWPYPLADKGLFLFIMWLIFLVGFVALVLFDLRWHWLPFKVVYPLIALAVFQTLVVTFVYHGGLSTLTGAATGVLVGSGIFFALYHLPRYIKQLPRQLIGDGDVLLGIVLGLLAGGASHAFLIIFVASLFGSCVAIPLLATGKADRKTHLPFGPFLLAATVVVVLFGERLINWYLHNFIV